MICTSTLYLQTVWGLHFFRSRPAGRPERERGVAACGCCCCLALSPTKTRPTDKQPSVDTVQERTEPNECCAVAVACGRRLHQCVRNSTTRCRPLCTGPHANARSAASPPASPRGGLHSERGGRTQSATEIARKACECSAWPSHSADTADTRRHSSRARTLPVHGDSPRRQATSLRKQTN